MSTDSTPSFQEKKSVFQRGGSFSADKLMQQLEQFNAFSKGLPPGELSKRVTKKTANDLSVVSQKAENEAAKLEKITEASGTPPTSTVANNPDADSNESGGPSAPPALTTPNAQPANTTPSGSPSTPPANTTPSGSPSAPPANTTPSGSPSTPPANTTPSVVQSASPALTTPNAQPANTTPSGSPSTPPANTTPSVVQSASQNTGMQSILANPGEAAKEASGFAGDVVGNVGAGLEIQKTAVKTLVNEQIKHLDVIKKTDRIEDVANRWDGTGIVFGGIGVLGGMIEFFKGAYDTYGYFRYRRGNAKEKFFAKEMAYSGVQGMTTGAAGATQGGMATAEIVKTTADIGKKAETVRDAADNAETLTASANEAVTNLSTIAADASVSATDFNEAVADTVGSITDAIDAQGATTASYDTLKTAVMESSDVSASSVVGIILGGVKTAIGGLNLIYDSVHMKKMKKFDPKSPQGKTWKNIIVNIIWKRIGWDTVKTLTGGAALAAGILALGNPVSVGAAVVVGATGSLVSLTGMFYKYYKKRKNKQKKNEAQKKVTGALDSQEDIDEAKELVKKLINESRNIKEDDIGAKTAGLKDEAGRASVMVTSAVREGENQNKDGTTIKELEGKADINDDDNKKLKLYVDGKETANALGVSEAAAKENPDTIKSRISVTSRM